MKKCYILLVLLACSVCHVIASNIMMESPVNNSPTVTEAGDEYICSPAVYFYGSAATGWCKSSMQFSLYKDNLGYLYVVYDRTGARVAVVKSGDRSFQYAFSFHGWFYFNL